MCGRVSCVLASGAPAPLARAAMPRDWAPRVNAGPASTLPVAVGGGGDTAILAAAWGVPRASSGTLVINARAESAAATPAWARLLARGPAGRCAALVDGFFEWRPGASRAHKQPYYVTRADGAPMALAGLIDRDGCGGTTLPRFAILTTDNPPCLAFLHDRAPAVLEDGPALRAWLSGATPPASFRPTTVPLAWHPVAKAVGSVTYQGADATADVRETGVAAAFARAADGKGKGTGEGAPPRAPKAAAPRSPQSAKRAPASTPPKPRARGQASLDAFLSPAPAKRPKWEDAEAG